MNTELTNAIVYSQENCFACNQAVSLLNRSGYEVEIRKIGEGESWSKKDLLELVPDARSVPQIFVGKYYIGGLPQLKQYLGVK
jgi:glutaredoxin 3